MKFQDISSGLFPINVATETPKIMQRFFCYLLIDIHIDVDGVDKIIEHILQNYHAGESTPVQFKKNKNLY